MTTHKTQPHFYMNLQPIGCTILHKFTTYNLLLEPCIRQRYNQHPEPYIPKIYNQHQDQHHKSLLTFLLEAQQTLLCFMQHCLGGKLLMPYSLAFL